MTLAPVSAFKGALTNALSDVVMSVIGLEIVSSASWRWLNGQTIDATHAGYIGVIVAYFFARNHLTAMNEMQKGATAREVTAEIKGQIDEREQKHHGNGQ